MTHLQDLRAAEARARAELTAARSGGNRERAEAAFKRWVEAQNAVETEERLAPLRAMEQR